MKKILVFILLITVPKMFLQNAYSQSGIEKQWPGFRGYMSSGVLDNANLPESFDLKKMINIKWKVEIPGLGLSSPVIWNEKLFITIEFVGFIKRLYNNSLATKLFI